MFESCYRRDQGDVQPSVMVAVLFLNQYCFIFRTNNSQIQAGIRDITLHFVKKTGIPKTFRLGRGGCGSRWTKSSNWICTYFTMSSSFHLYTTFRLNSTMYNF